MRKVSPKRIKEFERLANSDGTSEDAYEWVTRQIMTAKPHELVWLCLIRQGGERQQRAMELAMQARVAYWTRFATITALITSSLASVVAVVAIVAD